MYDTVTIAINMLCKLNFNVFDHVLSYKLSAGLSRFVYMNMVCY